LISYCLFPAFKSPWINPSILWIWPPRKR